MSIMIRTTGLKKIYRVGNEKVAALAGIDLEIEQGETCCIVGQSGCGKSTLLNMLAGLDKPTKGTVSIAGKKVTSMSEERLALFRQENLGFIFQSYYLLPQLTAVENAALPLMFAGMDKAKREKRALKELDKVGLADRANHRPSEMSGGQQQRVGIARAFVTRPKVIFADEPTGNLDTNTTAQVMQAMLQRVAQYGITFVMVTHEKSLAQMGDRIVTLSDGKVIGDERRKKQTEEII